MLYGIWRAKGSGNWVLFTESDRSLAALVRAGGLHTALFAGEAWVAGGVGGEEVASVQLFDVRWKLLVVVLPQYFTVTAFNTLTCNDIEIRGVLHSGVSVTLWFPVLVQRTLFSLSLPPLNTLWTGDANLRLCITAVEDGWRTSAFLTRAWFPHTIHFNYAIHAAFLRMVLLTDVYRNVTSRGSNDLW
jgi:hypothetical protein